MPDTRPERPKGYLLHRNVGPGDTYSYAEMEPDVDGGWYSSEDADAYMDWSDKAWRELVEALSREHEDAWQLYEELEGVGHFPEECKTCKLIARYTEAP